MNILLLALLLMQQGNTVTLTGGTSGTVRIADPNELVGVGGRIVTIGSLMPQQGNLKASVSGHQASFTWNASPSAAANPTLTYTLYRMSGTCPATPPTAEPGPFTAIMSGITGTAATDTSIVPGTWCYQLSAKVGTNESIPSNMVVVILANTQGILPPGSFVAVSAQ
jgi:hypothetical protein